MTFTPDCPECQAVQPFMTAAGEVIFAWRQWANDRTTEPGSETTIAFDKALANLALAGFAYGRRIKAQEIKGIWR